MLCPLPGLIFALRHYFIMDGLITLLRLVMTFLPALVFGLERQRSHKPAGFGTFIFVAIGACGLGLMASDIGLESGIGLLGATVTGIGFLGAGALIKTSDRIFGFTTAASIWVFAIFGLLVGAGNLLEAFLLYAFIWTIILFDKALERRGVGSYQKRLTVKTRRVVSESDVRRSLAEIGVGRMKLLELDVDKAGKSCNFVFFIEGRKENLDRVPRKLLQEEWFGSCGIE
jgi:uncharacterized membrane protein YhiD involved in acid resistance